MASSAWPGPGHALEDAGEEGRTDAWIAQDEADENRFPGEGVRAGGGPDEGSGERGAGEEQRIHAWEDETGPAMSDGDYQGNGGSDYGSNEGEEEDEDVAELIRDFGHNPMMDRVQEVLYTSLVKRYENVTEEIRDMKSDVKNVKQKREQVGVELYGLQQQLARLQITLEESHMSHATHEEGRLNAEEQLGQVKQVFMDRRQKHDDLFQSYTKNKKELNAVQDTLRQVETYNEEMKNEILVTRRATYKAEEAVQMLEKSKVDQDLYIDRMQEQIRQLREEVAELDAQVEMQQGQGNDAEKMMRDTNQASERSGYATWCTFKPGDVLLPPPNPTIMHACMHACYTTHRKWKLFNSKRSSCCNNGVAHLWGCSGEMRLLQPLTRHCEMPKFLPVIMI
jgi:hypothetical protein